MWRATVVSSVGAYVWLMCGVALAIGADAGGVPGQIHNITQGTYPSSIGQAIIAANYGDEIEVGPGTYYERIDLAGKAITLRSTDGPAVTILDGENGGTVITCANWEDELTVIDGFTVTNGAATSGAGMYMYRVEPRIQNCVFVNNVAEKGGGVFCDGSYPAIIGCKFVGNSLIEWNSWGAGMHIRQSFVQLINCVFDGNDAGLGNSQGGGLYAYQAAVEMINCTLTGNSANYGGAMLTRGESEIMMANGIIWGNGDDPILNWSNSTLTATYSCIEGGWIGTQNVSADPLFVDADGADDVAGTVDDDLRLQSGSACVDSGDNALVPYDDYDLDGDGIRSEKLPWDANGSLRLFDDPNSADTGSGIAPIVDRGAYEYRTIPGDCDDDGDVDYDDVSSVVVCMSGHGASVTSDCLCGDFDNDRDVDLRDFGLVQLLAF